MCAERANSGHHDAVLLTAGVYTSGTDERSARVGLWLGIAAVIFWSFGSSLVYLGARESGTWRLVAISSVSAGVLQLIFRRAYHGELQTSLGLPWRLWAVPVVCFVVYGLAWPCALASSSPSQVGGVNLINYLWPVLTVILSVWWVPGVRLTKRMTAALLLALAGLACANAGNIHDLVATNAIAMGSRLRQLIPYGLAVIAALTWAIYSAVLVRWRASAKNYVTSPISFLLIGLIACLVQIMSRPRPVTFSRFGLVMTLLYGVGPLAIGYLFWELALAKAKVQLLSLIAAATPVLSTVLLCCCLKQVPGIDLMLAALLVSGGVILSMRA
jgi:drug/metabolite transporter (DMT)-like permease